MYLLNDGCSLIHISLAVTFDQAVISKKGSNLSENRALGTTISDIQDPSLIEPALHAVARWRSLANLLKRCSRRLSMKIEAEAYWRDLW